jgi:hypothetical protein
MKKISLSVMTLSAAMMTACTDYVAEIEDIQEEREESLNAMNKNSNDIDPSAIFFRSGCICDVNRGNLIEKDGLLYYNPATNSPTITYALVGCTNMPDRVERLTGIYENLFVESYNVYQNDGFWWATLQLNGTAQNSLIGGSVSTYLSTYGDGKAMAGSVECPSIYFGYENSVQNSSAADNFTQSSNIPCGDLWCGPGDTWGQVATGSDEETAGYWYDFNDENDFGSSAISYPPDVAANEYDNFFGPLIEAYGGIKGSVVLGAGYDYPYAGLAFNLVGESQEGMDIYKWDGLCLVYSSTVKFAIELVVENEFEVTEYNNYKVSVPPSINTTTENFLWSKFKQESGWGIPVSRESVLKKVATIKLKFSGTAGTNGDFVFNSIGRHGTCQ